jgi:hypothetical protein
MQIHFPHVSMVPKTPTANLRFRRELFRQASGDQEMQAGLRKMCAEDCLFWLNTFGWTHDPRAVIGELPFLTYDYQDRLVIAEVMAAVGRNWLCFPKSRDMGLSWCILSTFLWFWMFKPSMNFILVSRNEEYVDKRGDPKALFWKLDYLLDRQPRWILPAGFDEDTHRKSLTLINPENGSTIVGESTTGDVARGGRATAILLDEFAAVNVDDGFRAYASVQHATKCVIACSTVQGVGNAFDTMMRKAAIRQVRIHWTMHPEKSKGLYVGPDGRPRSPWYDGECAKAPNAQWIAQELDIDSAGADWQYYPRVLLDRVALSTVRPPSFVGDLDFDLATQEPMGLMARPGGILKLWIKPDARGQMPFDRKYVIGCDLSAGTGASNSVLAIGDCKTGEKVGEVATSTMRPDKIADLAVALCKLFRGSSERGAFLIWEAPGPGRNFGDRVIELGYNNVYLRQAEGALSKKLNKIANVIPGWWPTPDERNAVHSDLRRSLDSNELIEHSADCVSELREIIFTQATGITHVRAVQNVDPSGAREHHGDRPTATALMLRGMRQMGLAKGVAGAPGEVPEGSMMARRVARLQAQPKTGDARWAG